MAYGVQHAHEACPGYEHVISCNVMQSTSDCFGHAGLPAPGLGPGQDRAGAAAGQPDAPWHVPSMGGSMSWSGVSQSEQSLDLLP